MVVCFQLGQWIGQRMDVGGPEVKLVMTTRHPKKRARHIRLGPKRAGGIRQGGQVVPLRL